MSCHLVCHACGHHQESGTFDPYKRCEKCDAPPEMLGLEADEDFGDEIETEDDEDE